MTDHLARLVRYDVWANRETLRSLGEGAVPPRSLRWMGHIIGAEFLWLGRIAGKAEPLPVWPDLSVSECEARLGELSHRLPDRLRDERARGLSRSVPYTNSKGEAWSNSVEEIFTHLVLHSAYHRGQIASDLRGAGREPAYTDYIHAIRQRFIE
jgi:uncharacterized damage-inducible protein DinB